MCNREEQNALTKVFISYSHHDRPVADYIAKQLEIRDADVFIDYQRLKGEEFVPRIGREIESSSFFVVLTSPHAVRSKWVRAEVTWAFSRDIPTRRVRLKEASMTDLFILEGLDYIDFSRWYVDQQVDDAIRKLARTLDLPETVDTIEPVKKPVAEPLPSPEEMAAIEEQETDSTGVFRTTDLSEIFRHAAEIQNDDPEQALFLYNQIIEVDPTFGEGRVRDFVSATERRLRPVLLDSRRVRAEDAMRAGEWKEARRIAQDMLELDAENGAAKDIVKQADENVKCEPIYRQAAVAAEKGQWSAVVNLTRHVLADCPDYGDPSDLLTIRKEALGSLRTLRILAGHQGFVHSIVFSPDSELLASAADDDHVKLWMRKAGFAELAPLGGNPGGQTHTPVTSLAYSPDGQLVVSGSTEKTIKFWEVSKNREVNSISAHADVIRCLTISPNGTLLASGSDDRHVILFRMPSGQRLETLTPGYQNSVSALAISPESNFLVSAAADGGVTVWNMTEGHQFPDDAGHKIAAYSLQSGHATSLAFSPDGSLLALGSTDNTIRMWRMPNKDELERAKPPNRLSSALEKKDRPALHGHYKKVNSVTFSPDSALLASASSDGTIKFWDASNEYSEVFTLETDDRPVHTVAFSPDGAC